jgi:small subunit ribosomal protein S8
MITNYPLGDFLIRIKNASIANRASMSVPSTKLIRAAAEVLKSEGYIREMSETDGQLDIHIAFAHKKPVLMNLKLVSKLGLRIYKNVDELKAHRGASFLIISTPKGVMSHRKAIKENVGGEVIAEVW